MTSVREGAAGGAPVSLRQFQRQATQWLAAAGVASPRLDARLLIGHALDLPPEAFLADPDRLLDPAAMAAAAALIQRRVAREPVARILGRREFWSLSFTLSAATLDPRPDTETLVQSALDQVKDRQAPLRVLDLGTGTGCILLALLSELPNATGLGIDIESGAVAVAAANAAALGFAGRAEFRAGDWTAGVTDRFDLVLANPPYIPDPEIPALEPEVAVYEPRRALAGGPDGLAAYRRLALEVPCVLASGGQAGFEVGAGQAPAVVAVLVAAGAVQPRVVPDLAGIDRCIWVNYLR